MKIFELTPYKNDERIEKFKDVMRDEKVSKTNRFTMFAQFMEEKGFKKLGNGFFGIVFAHPNLNYVIKIFYDDTPYVDFINYSKANSNNPHLPKFIGAPMSIDKIHWMVRVEKLTRVDIPVILEAITIINNLTSGQHNIDIEEKVMKYARRINDDSENYIPSVRYAVKYILENKSLMSTLKNIGKINEHRLDLHDENFMMRGETLVVTDPWYTFS